MLMYFKKRRAAKNPPTTKQVKYARMLKIQITELMSKDDVSTAISRVEKANPELVQKREQAKQKARIKRYGEEAIKIETHWNTICDQNPMVLLIYERGKNIIVDVVEVCGTEFDSKDKIKVCFVAPKLRKDQYLGTYLEWEKEFSVRPNKILHHELITQEIDFMDTDRYQKCVETGLQIAKKFTE